MIVTTGFDPLNQLLRHGMLDTGEMLSAESVRRLACDAGIIPAVLDSAGLPLDVGREQRLFKGALRRALVLRDGGCAFPGCDRPPKWCEGHHPISWRRRRHDLPGQRGPAVRAPPPAHSPQRMAGVHRRRRDARVHPPAARRPDPHPTAQPLPPTTLGRSAGTDCVPYVRRLLLCNDFTAAQDHITIGGCEWSRRVRTSDQQRDRRMASNCPAPARARQLPPGTRTALSAARPRPRSRCAVEPSVPIRVACPLCARSRRAVGRPSPRVAPAGAQGRRDDGASLVETLRCMACDAMIIPAV